MRTELGPSVWEKWLYDRREASGLGSVLDLVLRPVGQPWWKETRRTKLDV